MRVEFNMSEANAAINAFHAKAKAAFRLATLATAKDVVGKIVDWTKDVPGVGRTPGPPAKVYKRTGSLESGWDVAANALGIFSPVFHPSGRPRRFFQLGNEGRGDLIVEGGADDLDYYSIEAINKVRYALAIEESGTWKRPWPSRRRPYLIVHQALDESEDEFRAHIFEEWEKI
jgi:hypothetical protein